jgi:MFS family permease
MYRSALAQRDLRLLLGAMFVSFAGSWAYSVALLAVVFERTDSLAWVGAATVGRFVPQLLFSPYAGVIADRFERVRVMIGSDLLAGTMQLGLAVAVLTTAPVTLLIVLAGLTALSCAPYEPATSAALVEIV